MEGRPRVLKAAASITQTAFSAAGPVSKLPIALQPLKQFRRMLENVSPRGGWWRSCGFVVGGFG